MPFADMFCYYLGAALGTYTPKMDGGHSLANHGQAVYLGQLLRHLIDAPKIHEPFIEKEKADNSE
jgi:hypothetical protein